MMKDLNYMNNIVSRNDKNSNIAYVLKGCIGLD